MTGKDDSETSAGPALSAPDSLGYRRPLPGFSTNAAESSAKGGRRQRFRRDAALTEAMDSSLTGDAQRRLPDLGIAIKSSIGFWLVYLLLITSRAFILEFPDFWAMFARRLVLTGGGAELKGIADYAQGVLGRAVRVGRPRGLIGLPEAHSGMGFATLAGLVLFAASDPIDLRHVAQQQAVVRMTPNNLVQRLIAAVKSSY